MNKLPNNEINTDQPVDAFSYSEGATPKGYECDKCKASGVRLWREWNTFLSHQQLVCLACINKNTKTKGGYTPDPKDRKFLLYGPLRTLWRTEETEPNTWHYKSEAQPVPEGAEVIEEQDRTMTPDLKGSGSMAPAIPTEDGSTFWGYSSVPEDGCNWWYALPYSREAK
jgi:hypothetical protein